MADFSITVQNSIRSFGPAPSSKWGSGSPYSFTWGSSKWGEGTQDLIVSVRKLLSESISPTDLFAKGVSRTISNSLSPAFEMSAETLRTGNGYYYVFTKPTTDSELRANTSYSSGTAQSATWTAQTATSTTWS